LPTFDGERGREAGKEISVAGFGFNRNSKQKR
jgi:hypothetical protein